MESNLWLNGATYLGISIGGSHGNVESIKINFEGIDHFRMGNYEEAIEVFQEVITLYLKYEGFNNVGFCYMHLGDYSKAIEYYQQAIDMCPSFPIPYYNMGTCYSLMNDNEKAFSYYNQATAVYPEFIDAHIDTGILYYRLENFIEAIKSFQLAIDCTSDIEKSDKYKQDFTTRESVAYNYMGVSWERLSNYSEAIECYKHALEDSPNHSEAEANLGRIYSRMNNYKEAIASFQKVITKEPDNEEAYFDRGSVFWKMKNYDSAQKDFTRYIFLTGVNNKHTQEIIAFFKAHNTAPFILHRLLKILPLWALSDYKSLNQQVEEQSKTVLDFLDILQMQSFDKKDRGQYRHFLALCQFFMGDTAEAYQIFSEECKVEDSPQMVTMYYCLQSAILSSVPIKSIEPLQKQAVKEAERILSSGKYENLTDIYYAGLIFLHFGKDLEKAHQCFRRSKELLPAQYMLWETEQRQRQWMIVRDIKDLESRLPLNQTFGENLHPREIERNSALYLNNLRQFQFYYETLGVRQKIHPLKAELPFVNFYQYWQFNLDASEKSDLASFRANRQREKIYTEIESVFEGIQDIINLQKIEEVLEGSFLLREFQSLQTDSATISSEKFEKIIANRINTTAHNRNFIDFKIKGFSFLEAHQMIALYFFAKDKLSARTTANLIFYTIYTAKIRNPKLLYQIAEEGSLDGVIDNLKDSDQIKNEIKEYTMLLVHSFSTTLASSLGGFFSVFLVSFTLKSLTIAIQNSKNRKIQPLAADDYIQFLDEFGRQLANTRESSVYIEGLELILGNNKKTN